MTTIVVVIDRYLYDYYLTGYSEMIPGPCRPGRRGKREFVQVLRLVETFSQQGVAAACYDHTNDARKRLKKSSQSLAKERMVHSQGERGVVATMEDLLDLHAEPYDSRRSA